MLALLLLLVVFPFAMPDQFDEDNYGVKYADDCEVCKVVTLEFGRSLERSGKTTAVLETGYSVEKAKKKTKYRESELRLVEAMEELCHSLLGYSIHKERKDWTRFAPGTSETFQALEGLVAKGVKVDIGIPKELWHKPSAEITHLKTQCETLLESHEEDIEDWYFKHQDSVSLEEYLCRERFLRGKDSKCLDVKGDLGEIAKKKRKKKKKATTEHEFKVEL